MVNFYVKKIMRKQITIDEVPIRWKEKVQQELDKLNKNVIIRFLCKEIL